MQSYYISGSNLFTFRTKPTGSGVLKLSLQNMYTLENTTSSISAYKYNAMKAYYHSLHLYLHQILEMNIELPYWIVLVEAFGMALYKSTNPNQ